MAAATVGALLASGLAVALGAPAEAEEAPAVESPWTAFADARAVVDYVAGLPSPTAPAVAATSAAVRRAARVATYVRSLPDDGSTLPTGSGVQLVQDSDDVLTLLWRVCADPVTVEDVVFTALPDAQYPPNLIPQNTATAPGPVCVDPDAVDPTAVLYEAVNTLYLRPVLDAAQRLLDATRGYVGRPLPVLSPADAVKVATNVVNYLTGSGVAAVGSYVDQVTGLAWWLIGQAGVGTHLAETDVVLLYLGGQTEALANGTAPTREQALAAAESLAGWAQDQATAAQSVDPQPTVAIPPVASVEGPGVPAPVGDPSVQRASDDSIGIARDLERTAPPVSHCPDSQEKPDDPCEPPMTNPTGAAVQHNPTVYLIFWGAQWNTDSGLMSLRGSAEAFVRGLTGSAWQKLLDQYYDSKSHIGTTVTFGGTWVDPRTPVAGDQALLSEVKAAHTEKRWPNGQNVQFLVFPQPGVTYGGTGWCGYHTYAALGTSPDLVYGVVNSPVTAGCAKDYGGNVATSAMAVLSHEYAEMVTDPFMTAWKDKTRHQEIADMCARVRPLGTVGGQPVTTLWSNASNRCDLTHNPGTGYEVVATLDPPGAPYTPGHTYPGGKVVVRNTGTRAWYTTGAHPVQLVTRGGGCSPMHDPARNAIRPDRASTWADCAHVRVPVAVTVAPGQTLAFTVPLRPDGTLKPSTTFYQEFDLEIAGVARIPLYSAYYPALGGYVARLQSASDPVSQPAGQKVVVALAGSDTASVDVTFDNVEAGTWFDKEVVNLATYPPNQPSRWAAASWPRPPGVACTACRPARVERTTASPASYTFQFVLHVPANTLPGTYPVKVAPVADVPNASGGGIRTIEMQSTPVVVNLIVLAPNPTTREFVGVSTIGPSAPKDVAASAATPDVTQRWWACAVATGVDALDTEIGACTATVLHPDGSSGPALVASPGPQPGSTAYAVGNGLGPVRSGDIVRVCWSATSHYADGSAHYGTGCDDLSG